MFLLNTSFWEIKQTQDKGRGVYAKASIPAGTVIGDYRGKVIRTAVEDTSEKNGLYLLYYHDYASIYPEDIKATGVHLFNHSCAPNCWITIYKGHTLFFALRKIFPGEELTISYLLYPKELCSDCTHQCFCQSTFCTGTMHLSNEQFKSWSSFQERESQKTKRAPIRYGKILPKLKDYPKAIADNAIYTLFGAEEKEAKVMNDQTVPTVKALRELIRESGQKLFFTKLGKTVQGIKDNTIVT